MPSQAVVDLGLRRRSKGGEVAPRASVLPRRGFRGAKQILLMIHGFNVTLCEAGCAYSDFIRNHRATPDSQLSRLFWPGDASPASGYGRRTQLSFYASAATYGFQLGTAKKSAERLVAALDRCLPKRRTRKPVLNIVAHSLGCRLTLEALTAWAQRRKAQRPRFGSVALMAAALPRYMLLPQGELAAGASLPKKLVAFHSRSDSAVNRIFWAGQSHETLRHWIAHRSFAATGSVGRYGLPQTTRGHNISVDQADHGHYWPNRAVTSVIEESFRQRPLLPKKLPRPLIGWHAGSRPLPSRPLPSRAPGRQQGLCRRCPPCADS